MRRTRLRNKFIDSKTDAYSIAYNKQCNYCITLLEKGNTLNDPEISPEAEKVISDHSGIGRTFNEFFLRTYIPVLKFCRKKIAKQMYETITIQS